MIDAVDHRQVGIIGRRRNQDPLGAGVEMRLRLLLGCKDTGTFERDVDVQRFPWQFGRILDRRDLDGPDAAIDGVALDLDVAVEAPVNGVEAQQMRIGFRRSEIVESHDLDVLASGLHNGAQDIAANAAKTVDGDANRHFWLPRFKSSLCDGSQWLWSSVRWVALAESKDVSSRCGPVLNFAALIT